MRIMRVHNLHSPYSERLITLSTWTWQFFNFTCILSPHTIMWTLNRLHKILFTTLRDTLHHLPLVCIPDTSLSALSYKFLSHKKKSEKGLFLVQRCLHAARAAWARSRNVFDYSYSRELNVDVHKRRLLFLFRLLSVCMQVRVLTYWHEV